MRSSMVLSRDEAPTLPESQDEGAVSPPREAKVTDASKLNFPLPLAITLVTLAVAAAAGIWRIESKVNVITTTIQYERQLDEQREKYLDQRFAALEAKIESAGLRNAAMSMYQGLTAEQQKSNTAK